MYRATAEIVSGSKVFAGGKWLKCIGNKRVSVGERIWTDGRCVYGHFQEAQQPLVSSVTGDGDEAIPILAGKQCYIFYRGKLQLIGELDKEYSLMINDTRGNVFVYDDDTGARIDGNIREELKAANIDKAGNHYYLTQMYEIEDKDREIVGDLRIWKNGEVVDICSSPKKFADEVYDSVEFPDFSGLPTKSGDGNPYYHYHVQYYAVGFIEHFIENPECWSLFQDVHVRKYAGVTSGDDEIWKRNSVVEFQYIFRNRKNALAHATSWWDRTEYVTVVNEQDFSYSIPWFEERQGLYDHYEPATYNSATIALQDGFYYQAEPEPKRPWYEGGIEHQNFYKTFFSPQGNKIFELDRYAHGKHLITRVAGGYLFKLDNYEGYDSSWLYLCKNNTLELIYQSKRGQANKIKNQRLRPMKRYKNWHKRIKEINLNQTA